MSRDDTSFAFWALVVGVVAGYLLGAFLGYSHGMERAGRAVHIEDACMAGNNNACRVMERRP